MTESALIVKLLVKAPDANAVLRALQEQGSGWTEGQIAWTELVVLRLRVFGRERPERCASIHVQ